jgi:hypothetical protein
LFSVTHPAMDDRDTQVGEAPIIAKCRFDLGGKLARRFENETAEITSLGEEREDGQREGRRFAGAGLSRADQISARQDNWKSSELNGRRLREAHRLRAAHYFR